MIPIRRPQAIVLGALCLIASTRVAAQNICLAPVTPGDSPVRIERPPVDFLEIRPGHISGGGSNGLVEFSDGLSISYRGGVISAESGRYSDSDPLIEVFDNVKVTGDSFEVSASNATFDKESQSTRLNEAAVNLTEQGGRATAAEVTLRQDGFISLTDIMFTTCPEDDLDWQLLGRELELDPEAGFGRARGVRLKFKGVPILAAPFFSFPIDDRRKSGFLAPNFSERDRTGIDISIPYYLNLAPNYDLLLEPRFMADRGAQIRSSFRYLLAGSSGELKFERLHDDDILKQARHFVHLDHESRFGEHWELNTFVEDVSDSAYFEDMGDSLGVISQTHLDRTVDLAFYAPRWSFLSRVQEYQTIDDLIIDADRPYQRRPQMLFRGRWGDRIVGFESTTEAVDFDRNVGVTGWRMDSTQELSLRFARAGMYLTPAVGYRQTNYRIDDAGIVADRSLSRGLPVTSLDAGLKFERDAGRTQSWIQTVEPRVLYVRIPYEDQSILPVFDTILPDFNLVQLFSKYQFVGGDRIADTNRVSIGVTTRLINSASGRERVSATIGQTRYRNPRRVLLPQELAVDSKRSNYVAELGINLGEAWNLDLGTQWNGDTGDTVRAETRFEYRPEADRLFGIGYRMRQDVLEQGDLSVIWPVGDRWRLIGQYSYSLLEKKPLERFAGIEYEACCWRLRLTSRRYIIRSTGTTDNSFSVELELLGLARRTATAEELLGRGILGYRPLDPSQY